MADKLKVINGLKCCIPMTTRDGFADCKKCPYDRKITLDGGITECCHDLMVDALALLKAQEPVSVIPAKEKDGELLREGNCPVCGMKLDWFYNGNYCGCCGRAVKWQ